MKIKAVLLIAFIYTIIAEIVSTIYKTLLRFRTKYPTNNLNLYQNTIVLLWNLKRDKQHFIASLASVLREEKEGLKLSFDKTSFFLTHFKLSDTKQLIKKLIDNIKIVVKIEVSAWMSYLILIKKKLLALLRYFKE